MSKKIKIFLAILVIIIGLGGLYLTMNFKKVLSAVSGVINVSARLAGVSAPVNSNDVATKAYVDSLNAAPSNWTCTVRSNSTTSLPTNGAIDVYCQGAEKVISGGCSSSCSANNTHTGIPINQGWRCYNLYLQSCNYEVYANCCQ
jgi:hypothetical protein